MCQTGICQSRGALLGLAGQDAGTHQWQGVVFCVLRIARSMRGQTGTVLGVLEEQDRGSSRVSQGRSRPPVSGP
eukprot:11172900-Lingulodinium_polyedra.AAC.1